MTNTSVQAAIHDRIDPVLEAIIKGLIESASHPEMSAETDDAVTQALTEALMVALITPPSTRPSKPAAEITPFGATLASALATALAPALAETLTPAIVDTLSKMASAEKERSAQERPGQEKASQESALAKVPNRRDRALRLWECVMWHALPKAQGSVPTNSLQPFDIPLFSGLMRSPFPNYTLDSVNLRFFGLRPKNKGGVRLRAERENA